MPVKWLREDERMFAEGSIDPGRGAEPGAVHGTSGDK